MSRTAAAPLMLLPLFAAGCMVAAPPEISPPTPEETTFRVDAPTDRVWSAVTRVFTAANIPIENMDKASGFIRSRDMAMAPGEEVRGLKSTDLADCGKNGMGYENLALGSLQVAFTVLIEEAADGTEMMVRSDPRGSQGMKFSCVSTGEFENLIAELVREEIR